VREPEEQIFASGVLSYSTAGNAAEKAASLAALSRLTQEMMRQATWKQLQRHQMVNVIQTVVTSLGFNLTKKKLAQVVPVAGCSSTADSMHDWRRTPSSEPRMHTSCDSSPRNTV
jgi:hypothetical protein